MLRFCVLPKVYSYESGEVCEYDIIIDRTHVDFAGYEYSMTFEIDDGYGHPEQRAVSEDWLFHDEEERIKRIAHKIVKRQRGFWQWYRFRDIYTGANPVRLEKLENWQNKPIYQRLKDVRSLSERRHRKICFA